MPRQSPTVGRRRLGSELRRLREAAGLTIDRVGEALQFSESKVSRIETGRVSARPLDVQGMLELYGVDTGAREPLVQLARETRERGWWQAYNDVPLVPTYIGLEVAAASIRLYQALVVPGLLQTVDYARAAIRAVFPELPQDEVERRIELRMARTVLLTQDDPVALWAVVDEAAVRRPVGGPAVLRQQLEHLAEMSRSLASVSLGVLPFASGGHPGLDGSFTLLSFPDPADPDVVYLDHAGGDLYLERTEEVQLYNLLFDRLRAAAREPRDSVDFLMALAKEL